MPECTCRLSGKNQQGKYLSFHHDNPWEQSQIELETENEWEHKTLTFVEIENNVSLFSRRNKITTIILNMRRTFSIRKSIWIIHNSKARQLLGDWFWDYWIHFSLCIRLEVCIFNNKWESEKNHVIWLWRVHFSPYFENTVWKNQYMILSDSGENNCSYGTHNI